MITGFNTNVRYGGRVYHVQTEDSGRSHPHVITHVYHGGTILASEKREYADQLGEDDLPTIVRRLMEEQHQVMVSRLKGGDLDGLISERIGGVPSATPASAEPGGDSGPDLGVVLGSEKPLDEMILEYLVKKARDRASGQSSRSSRSRG